MLTSVSLMALEDGQLLAEARSSYFDASKSKQTQCKASSNRRSNGELTLAIRLCSAINWVLFEAIL